MEAIVHEINVGEGFLESSEMKLTNEVRGADEGQMQSLEEVSAVTSGEAPYHSPVIKEQVFEEISNADHIEPDPKEVEEDPAGLVKYVETQTVKSKKEDLQKNITPNQTAKQKKPKKRCSSKDMRIYESFRRIATETMASQGPFRPSQAAFSANQWYQEPTEDSVSVRAQAIHSVQSTAIQAMRAIQQIVASQASLEAPPPGRGLFKQPKNRRNRSRNLPQNLQQQAVHNLIWNPVQLAAKNRRQKRRQQHQPQQQAAASTSAAPSTPMEVQEPEQAPAGLPDDRAYAGGQDTSQSQLDPFHLQSQDENSDLPSGNRGDGEIGMAAQAEDKDGRPSDDRVASESPDGRRG